MVFCLFNLTKIHCGQWDSLSWGHEFFEGANVKFLHVAREPSSIETKTCEDNENKVMSIAKS